MVIYFKNYSIKDIIRPRDKKLWDKVTSDANNALHELDLKDHFDPEVTIMNYL